MYRCPRTHTHTGRVYLRAVLSRRPSAAIAVTTTTATSTHTTHAWMGGLVEQRLGRWTCDREVVGSTPDPVAIEWLVPGWVTVGGHVNHLGM